MKTISYFSLVLTMASLLGMNAFGDQLFCHSREDAPAYRNAKGLWLLKAEISSDYRLKNIKLSNKKYPKLGATTEQSQYDKRSYESRNFRLRPDVFCNYELQIPRDFSRSKDFSGSLIETCDDMFDALAGLRCTIKKD